jgi:hypothetical protein
MAASLIIAFAAVAPASATPPTDIEVNPHYRSLTTYCGWFAPPHVERAYWTVSLSGGGSGQYKVTVYWGDGSPSSTTYHNGSYDTHHDFICQRGEEDQSWSGWRSGGGTDYDYTTVNTF